MLLKNLSDLSLQDVQTLCDNRVTDNRFIDFKAEAIGRKEGKGASSSPTFAPSPTRQAAISSSASKRRTEPPKRSAASTSPIRTRKSSS